MIVEKEMELKETKERGIEGGIPEKDKSIGQGYERVMEVGAETRRVLGF